VPLVTRLSTAANNLAAYLPANKNCHQRWYLRLQPPGG